MYIRTTSLLALYIRNTRRYEHPSSATLAYRGGAMQTLTPSLFELEKKGTFE